MDTETWSKGKHIFQPMLYVGKIQNIFLFDLPNWKNYIILTARIQFLSPRSWWWQESLLFNAWSLAAIYTWFILLQLRRPDWSSNTGLFRTIGYTHEYASAFRPRMEEILKCNEWTMEKVAFLRHMYIQGICYAIGAGQVPFICRRIFFWW